jgi:hypothetical protein
VIVLHENWAPATQEEAHLESKRVYEREIRNFGNPSYIKGLHEALFIISKQLMLLSKKGEPE